jgi:ABC-2 type transport system permease protein
MEKIKTIILKEWAEVFKNRMVIFTIIFMPLLFTAIPLIMLAVLQSPGSTGLNSELPGQLSQICPPNLDSGVCFQVQMVSQFMLLFMLMPLIIPVNIAAYSIVGEKTTRSLEPLLATPITTAELLTGKNLAAAIPAILATLAGFLIFAVGAAIIVHNPAALSALLNPMWLLAVFVLGPLLAILSVNFSLMVSSRVNEPRAAEQLSAVVIIPVLLIFFGQIFGFFIINSKLILLMIVILFVVDLAVIYAAVRLFQRETILTRWK